MARVMIVEDEGLVAKGIAQILTLLGHEVPAVVGTAEDAIASASMVRPELILMDVRLRGSMDGIDTAIEIRKSLDVPVVFLTAFSDRESLSRAKASEPYGYLVKPYSDRELFTTIEVALHKHRLERQLRERERWFSTTLESIGDGVIAADIDQRVTFLNAVAERLTGWSSEEARGRHVDEVFPLLVEDTRGVRACPLERAIRERVTTCLEGPTVLMRRDGRELPVDDSAAPIVDDDGVLLGGVLVFRDITDRREMEARLALSDRMASLGTLTAGIGHEINNPLAATLGNLWCARQDLGDLQQQLTASGTADPAALADRVAALDQLLREAEDGADRVRRIVGDLRTFARAPGKPTTLVALDQVIEAGIRMAWNEVRHRAELRKELRASPSVIGDETQLAQVVTNLLVNAAQAIPDGGRDHVVTVVLDEVPGGRAILEVHDTGVGIPPDLMVRIFEPFFTTKPVGIGSGLGLPILYRIVTSHGGDIDVTSRPGHTVFRITLPSPSPVLNPAPASAPATEASVARTRARVLVVDDDTAVLAMIQRALRRHHEVVARASAHDALALLDGGESFEVILCDVMMPGMTGVELHERLQSAHPDHADRMLFLTGGAFTLQAQEFLASRPERELPKPISIRQLEDAIAAVLARSPTAIRSG